MKIGLRVYEKARPSFLKSGPGQPGLFPYFMRAQYFRARVEPKRARAWPSYPRACFEPELFTNKYAKTWIRAYLKPLGKFLCLIYCEPKIRPGPSSPRPGSFHLQLKSSFVTLKCKHRWNEKKASVHCLDSAWLLGQEATVPNATYLVLWEKVWW